MCEGWCNTGICGGLRSADLVSLQISNVELNETTGYWVSYAVSKQKGMAMANKFHVPTAYSYYIKNHLDQLEVCGITEGRLFRSVRKRSNGETYYACQHMGIHKISKMVAPAGECSSSSNVTSNVNTNIVDVVERKEAPAKQIDISNRSNFVIHF